MKPYVSQGITLIELMIVVAILSILLAIAVPSFNNLILSNQISSDLSDFVGALRRAKTESSARLTSVSLCVRNGNVCSNAARWENGWLVFLDVNNDGDKDTSEGNNETIIYQKEALGRQVTFRETINGARSITFRPAGNGATLDRAARFVMCSQDQQTIIRGINITVAGQSSPLDNPASCQQEVANE